MLCHFWRDVSRSSSHSLSQEQHWQCQWGGVEIPRSGMCCVLGYSSLLNSYVLHTHVRLYQKKKKQHLSRTPQISPFLIPPSQSPVKKSLWVRNNVLFSVSTLLCTHSSTRWLVCFWLSHSLSKRSGNEDKICGFWLCLFRGCGLMGQFSFLNHC